MTVVLFAIKTAATAATIKITNAMAMLVAIEFTGILNVKI